MFSSTTAHLLMWFG